MNLVQKLEQYHHEHVFFCEPIKNNIMNEGTFIRILYSSDIMSLNGIYLLANFNHITCEKYYNKYKYNFNPLNHKEMIETIKHIEETILKKYQTDKLACYKIYEQLTGGCIKLFDNVKTFEHNNSVSFILKISGIWETHTNYGLTYKFILINDKQ